MDDGIITTRTLLEHIQGMKSDLQTQITDVAQSLKDLKKDVTNLTESTKRGFEEAREHRQALQEDLNATIRMVGKHEVKLAKIKTHK